tara:strand:- start:851 stop:2155 length:1305 start_codon:yes stop_codon:yes gene_type:complete
MKRLETKTVLIDTIQVGERFRVDYGDVESLAQSIKSEGLINPITIDTESNLLAGGRRLAACKLLGKDSIEVNIFKIESEYELRIIELIENIQRKEMLWSEQANLVQRINTLMKKEDPAWTQKQTAGLLNMSTGHISDQIMIADVSENVPELQELPSFKEAVRTYRALCASMAENELSERLQHKAETAHRAEQGAEDEQSYDPSLAFVATNALAYQIGDCIENIPKLEQEFDFVEIDPPYDASFDYKYDKTKLEIYGNRTYHDFMSEVIESSFHVMRHNSFMLVWFPTRDFCMFSDILRNVFKGSYDPIPSIWYKETQPAGDIDKMLARRYESFFTAWKGDPVLQLKGLPNVFQYNTVPASERWHPVQRPLDLMIKLHEIYCPTAGNTLIPFAGSGTPINAHFLRNPIPGSCVGFDINENFRTRYLANLTYPGSK